MPGYARPAWTLPYNLALNAVQIDQYMWIVARKKGKAVQSCPGCRSQLDLGIETIQIDGVIAAGRILVSLVIRSHRLVWRHSSTPTTGIIIGSPGPPAEKPTTVGLE